MIRRRVRSTLVAFAVLLSACGIPAFSGSSDGSQPLELATVPGVGLETGTATPLPIRPNYKPGELVDYVAQTGDTIPGLAAHFNTTVAEIMAANPIVPLEATTMPPGLPMKIPVYFKSLWGNPFHILPDSLFVNGPAQIGFNTAAFVAARPGWWKSYSAYTEGGNRERTGAEVVDYVAQNYSISPRLLLAILQYQAGALSQINRPKKLYILDFPQVINARAPNLDYLQLLWAANTLNNGYYGWRAGTLTEFDEPDGTIIRPDPWQNAASVAIQYLFSRTMSGAVYDAAIGTSGLSMTYEALFGRASDQAAPLIPGSLKQPHLTFPFVPGQVWTYTGGPHTGWGTGEPLSAVDFAPPCDHPGCASLSPQSYVPAMADGLVVRSGPDGVVLDLDGDGDERTGWDIFILHLALHGRVVAGQILHAGDPMGFPSSEGGEATGTHVHIARKYNGEWMLADGPLGFDLDGWIVHAGEAAYKGTLTRNGVTVTACSCSDLYSEIQVLPAP